MCVCCVFFGFVSTLLTPNPKHNALFPKKKGINLNLDVGVAGANGAVNPVDGPFLRAVSLGVIPDQIFADLSDGLGVLLPANVSFFNPINVDIELLDMFLTFNAGETDPNNPFGGLISGIDVIKP